MRNFVQQGLAFGNTTASVTVTLDGSEIYQGPVPTVDQPVPDHPIPEINNTAWQWTLPVDFVGTKVMVFTVQGSPFVLADTCADRNYVDDVAAIEPLAYTQLVDGVAVIDPLTNVTIGGMSQTRGTDKGGQWYWVVQPGQTFSATLNVPLAAVTNPDWDPAETYQPATSVVDAVVYGNKVWTNGISVSPAGTIPQDNRSIWYTPPTIAEWNPSQNYEIYSRVRYGYDVFRAEQAVPAGTVPGTDNAYWLYRSSPN